MLSSSKLVPVLCGGVFGLRLRCSATSMASKTEQSLGNETEKTASVVFLSQVKARLIKSSNFSEEKTAFSLHDVSTLTRLKAGKLRRRIRRDEKCEAPMSDEDLKRLSQIKAEYEFWRRCCPQDANTGAMPRHVSEEQWNYLLRLEPRTARIAKLIRYRRDEDKALARQHCDSASEDNFLDFDLPPNFSFDLVDDAAAYDDTLTDDIEDQYFLIPRRISHKETAHSTTAYPQENTPQTCPQLGQSTLFLETAFKTSKIILHRRNRLMSAIRCGAAPKLVFDMSFLLHLNLRERLSCHRQLSACIYHNLNSKSPFQLHMCGVDKKSFHRNVLDRLHRRKEFDIVVNPLLHTDIFPKEKLLYLTENSPNVLKPGDLDYRILIVGASVDINQALSSQQVAEANGLATATIPWVQFASGYVSSPELTIAEVFFILQDLYSGCSLETAVRNNVYKAAVNKLQLEIAAISQRRWVAVIEQMDVMVPPNLTLENVKTFEPYIDTYFGV